jgi:hypothetical protein
MRAAADFAPTRKSVARFYAPVLVRSAQKRAKIVAPDAEIHERVQSGRARQLPAPQNFYLRKTEIVHDARIPLPHEGRFAVVTDVGSGMRWTDWRS